ncbi:hypothetical protein G6M89_13645 [Natronolimnobius sp. AArcel1]|uniref:hypothetical protein n=1 Tax=Natronolimnobius sp. AArcel1 TaxID=1679093 RepID=UPI0013EB4F70|nr:hypothetical protein [Natronolimnobius sp. AArcel1]NGM70035.1 hypothetical protein [Natronolimnobius sp. AArcel1]
MTTETERQRDLLSMLVAIQFTLFIILIPWAWPLLAVPGLRTNCVNRSEYHRRLTEHESGAEIGESSSAKQGLESDDSPTQ